MFRLRILITSIIIALGQIATATPTAEQPDRNISVYLLQAGQIGLQGYDPVSYFAEGGGVPMEGLVENSVEYGGVVYKFANSENMKIFMQTPTRFEPTYGGWCAWAMANNSFAEIDPMLFTLTKHVGSDIQSTNDESARRLHLYISRGAKARFDSDLNKYENMADVNWAQDPKLTDKSGEQPRL